MATLSRVPLLLLVHLTVVLAQLGAPSCEGGACRLRGSVACLDCAAGHDLSGVIVAVKCASGNAGTAALHAAETDARGTFDVAMPATSSGSSPCAARLLGATQRLCAPPRLTVARVPEHAPAYSTTSSYALASLLAFFTRCSPDAGGGNAAAATTMAARDQGKRAAPRPRGPVWSPPPTGGRGSGSPYGMGGLPLIFLFPFVPIIGIP